MFSPSLRRLSWQKIAGRTAILAASVLAAGARPASADTVRVTVENVGSDGTTFITPVFAGFHDGSYSIGSIGGTASAGLEGLAELGMTGTINDEFMAGGLARVSTTFNAGVGPIAPGQSVTETLEIGDNAFLSLASMVLPSSDYFLGNISTPAFDLNSLAVGNPLTFTLSNLYDAGTELNDFNTSPGNPLFSLPAGNAPLSTPELAGNDTIRLVTNPFGDFENTPAGGFSPNISQLRVTISAVPEPGTGFACCAVIGGLVMRRRRRK